MVKSKQMENPATKTMTFNGFAAIIPLMQARILNQSEEHLWLEFVKNHPLGTIHQTPEWGHFQANVKGRGKYWIVALTGADTGSNSDRARSQESTSQILAGTLLIRHQLPKGYCWLYAPRGPLLNYDSADNYHAAHSQMAILLSEIKEIAQAEKAVFLRIDPMLPSSDFSCFEKSARADFLPQQMAPLSHLASDFSHPLHFPHFRQNIHGFQPDHTLILDLTQSAQDLLSQMKPKGRYNIKLAEKKGVKIRQADPAKQKQFSKDLSDFCKILTETTSRDGFHGHDMDFYKNMVEDLQNDSTYSDSLTGVSQDSDRNLVNPRRQYATLYLAEYENLIVAACLNTFFKDTATYYYGASSNLHRNVMAPYLLHWQVIKDAKQKGCKFYDFFGIAPEDAKNHPWSGVTDFKKKFGGQEISYQKPQEFIFKKALYLLYRAYKKLK